MQYIQYNKNYSSTLINSISYIMCNFNYDYEKYNNNYLNIKYFDINFFNTLNQEFELFIRYYPNFYIFLLTFFTVVTSDIILLIIFGSRARWFQLHSFINFIITLIIIKEYFQIIINPKLGYVIITNHYASYLILNLHIFHLFTFKNLGLHDYFHHVLFVGLDVLPTIFYIKTNQCYMGYIPCGGIPGIIEYFILALYKNNKISLIKQKYINSLNYNYFRYPLCIIGATYNFINYNNGNLIDNFWMTLYINVLLLFNGSLFNFLTLGSYFEKKYNKII